MDCAKEWVKAKLSDSADTEIPLIGQSVVLYLCPHDRTKAWASDIGSLYLEGGAFPESEDADALMWSSAFGLCSAFDGVKFENILKDNDVCFAAVPPLEAGRFPSPLGISHEQREANYRAHINRVLENLK